MNKKISIRGWLMVILLIPAPGFLSAGPGTGGTDSVPLSGKSGTDVLKVESHSTVLYFTWDDPRVAAVRLAVRDEESHLIFDSGEQPGNSAGWDCRHQASAGRAVFELLGWDDEGKVILRQSGEILPPAAVGEAPVVTAYDVAGNYTISGNLGIGTSTPERAIHIKGSNAVFRMDRSRDTAAFMIVRNDTSNNILKSFVVGVNASGVNQGSFVINDLGASTSGAGANRLTIDNNGDAIFGREVRATGFVTTSSRRFKTDIRPLENPLQKILQLQGVTFRWKDSGESSLGLIAEDTARIAPEVVVTGADGQPAGIDYGKVSTLLLESLKAQQQEIEQLEKDCRGLEERLKQELAATETERGKKPGR